VFIKLKTTYIHIGDELGSILPWFQKFLISSQDSWLPKVGCNLKGAESKLLQYYYLQIFIVVVYDKSTTILFSIPKDLLNY
jgi:hypothetical protein